MKTRRTNLVLASVFFIMASLVYSTTNINYKVMPPTYAQTNAAALNTTTLSANNNNTTNNTTTTPKEGLQINKVKYFDNFSGYLVYSSPAADIS